MDDIEIHPAAECFRLMHQDELDALVEDIRANGLRDPITLGRVNGGIKLTRKRLAPLLASADQGAPNLTSSTALVSHLAPSAPQTLPGGAVASSLFIIDS